jgi:hypothetical protein
MGRFSRIKEARYSEGGVYVLPGVYMFEILACKAGETRSGVPFFVVELKILESNNDDRPVGSECSWFVGLDKEPALGNIKQFVSAATGSPLDEVDEEAVELIVSKDNPLAGHVIHASAINIKTKKGGDFTRVKWSPVDSDDDEPEAAAS